MSNLRERAAAGNSVATTNGNGVATNQQPGIAGFLVQLQPQIERALPQHLNADRMARLALTEIRKTPKLAESTPSSFAGALLTAAALGLEVGTTGEAYLVPYEHRRGAQAGTVECQLIVGYQGLAKLFWQHPLAMGLDAQAVYEKDDFDYAYGTAKFLRHKPASGDRGEEITHYYAVAELTTGASHFVVLTPAEVRKLRGGKTGTSGSIDDPQRWMERKTVLRQLLKTLPKSTTLNTALVVDEKVGSELQRDLIASRQIPATPAPALDGPTQPSSPPITDAQKGKMHASFKDAGIEDHDGRVGFCTEVLGYPISSTNDLTVAEAIRVIDRLEEYGTQTPPAGEPGLADPADPNDPWASAGAQ